MLTDTTETHWAADGRLSGPVHSFFGLTYSSYLILERVLLQSMPLAWQEEFVCLLEECRAAFQDADKPDEYRVTPVGPSGRFAPQTLPSYRHGSIRPDEAAMRKARIEARTEVQPDRSRALLHLLEDCVEHGTATRAVLDEARRVAGVIA